MVDRPDNPAIRPLAHRPLAARRRGTACSLMVVVGGITRLTESGLSITALGAGQRRPCRR